MRRFTEVSVPQITHFFNRPVSRPDTQTLLTADGVRLSAVHRPGRDLEWAFVVCHGFTGSWSTADMARVIGALRPFGGVVAFDFRGHGRSRGRSTVGDMEVFDLHAAVEWARVLGYRNVATVGFSMGASVVVRHGALSASGGRGHSSTTDAVVSVSGPGWWFERSTWPMKGVHWLIENKAGRLVGEAAFGTRVVSDRRWDPVPESPVDLAHRIAPVPLLVVHGDADRFFPVAHAKALYAAAGEPRELWIEPGLGHAEAAAGIALLRRIGRWVIATSGSPGESGWSGPSGKSGRSGDEAAEA
jgi:pimeloyl-ACP methyl ester carboxylesterase